MLPTMAQCWVYHGHVCKEGWLRQLYMCGKHTCVSCLTPELQESRKLKPASLLDTILCSTKELRMKQYRNPNAK